MKGKVWYFSCILARKRNESGTYLDKESSLFFIFFDYNPSGTTGSAHIFVPAVLKPAADLERLNTNPTRRSERYDIG